MRILIHGNAPWAGTGYGTQGALLAPRFRALGHDVFFSAFYGLSGKTSTWHDFPVLPGGMDSYGNDVIWGHAKHLKADLVLVLVDSWVIEVPPYQGINVASFVPVDCSPLSFLDDARLRSSGTLPIAVSRFGEKMLTDAGFSPAYVPHGIDTKVFAPATNRSSIRDELGIPQDSFVIAMNAANKDAVRKAFPEQILAFARFHERHPDSMMLIHAMNQAPGAVNLTDIITRCGYDVGKSIRISDQYSVITGMVTPENLAAWYNAADIVTNTSFGEGFGLTPLEAQACGTPVVVSDYTAMSELCGAGWKVGGEPFWNGAHKSWWLKPHVDEIDNAYEKAWRASQNQKMGPRQKRARQFALRYDYDKVMKKYWVPFLNRVEERLRDGIIISAAGLKWRVRDTHPTGDILGPSHEGNVENEVLSMLPSGGVFLDVGAHVGHYTLRALAAGASKVIAIEPGSSTARKLWENLELNGLDTDRVVIHQVAAWDGNAKLKLENVGVTDTDGSTWAVEAEDGTIKGRALDPLLKTLKRLDLVKMDVEGSDLRALRGMSRTLDRLKPVLFIEDHSLYGYYKQHELIDLLVELGYKPELKNSSGYSYVVARHE